MYDSRRPPEPSYPSVHPSLADFIADEVTENEALTPQDEELDGDPDRLAEIEFLHAPPGSVLFQGFGLGAHYKEHTCSCFIFLRV